MKVRITVSIPDITDGEYGTLVTELRNSLKKLQSADRPDVSIVKGEDFSVAKAE